MIDNRVKSKEDGLYFKEQKIIDFIPKVTGFKETIIGNETKLYYDLSIYKNGEVIANITINDLYVRNWFKLSTKCPTAMLSEKHKKMIQQYLEEQVSKMDAVHEVLLDKTGWWEFGEQRVFFQKNMITWNLKDVIRSTNGNISMIDANSFSYDMSQSKEMLMQIDACAVGTSWIMYMISYLDILKYLFDKAGYPIAFVTNLYGESGRGKTSLIKAICNPIQFSFMGRRCDNLLQRVKTYCGHTVLIDDFHPTKSQADNEKQYRIKDTLVRMIEEVVTSPNVIISSEYLEGNFSLQDRELQIFLEREIDFSILGQLENQKDVLEDIRTAFYVQI